MTPASLPDVDPAPAPDLAQVVSVPADQPALVHCKAEGVRMMQGLATGGFVDLPLTGMRHGRLGFGLGGGLV